MLHWIRANYQDVIEVSKAKGQASEDLVFETLKSLSCIPHIEGHLDELEKAKRSCNGCP